MSDNQLTSSLTTSTDVPMSGTGASTPETAAANDGYATWPWEVMLATVLDVGIPDRSEVSGQPWLTVTTGGQTLAGAHLIWTAGWSTGPGAGASSIQVYLDPALYTTGGAWDRFLNAPAQALTGTAGGNYAGLPLKPPDFQALSLAVASVRQWMATATDELAALHQTASSGAVARFQGNLADVVAELLGDLRGFMASLHEQMTSPTAYDASITAAGDAASRFLADLNSAYAGWTGLPGHSPLGALVGVLENIATQDGNGGYVIPDPQHTTYGDLTVSGSWAAVEQQAKTQWATTLAGPADFGGLDPLGRAALSRLVDQFATTAGVIVPVLGPAPPSPTPNPVDTGSGHPHPNGSGHPSPGPGPGPGPHQDYLAGGGPNGLNGSGNVLPTGGPNGPAVLTAVPAGTTGGPGPAAGQVSLLVQPGTTGGQNPAGLAAAGPLPAGPAPAGPGAGPAFGAAVPALLLAAGSRGSLLAATGSPAGLAATGNPVLAGEPAADLAAGDGPAADGPLSLAAGLPAGLSGAIGADAAGPGLAGELARAADLAAGAGGFSGTIGRPAEAVDGGSPLDGHRDRKGAALPAAGRRAPAPGFSLGRDSAGPVLKSLAVPAVLAKPPAVTSSPVNLRLTPAGGPGGPAGLSASTSAAGPQAPASLTAAPGGPATGTSETVALPPGAGGAGGTSAANLATGDPASGEGGPMMLPPGLGGRGGGQSSRERQRLAYLPEEPEYWGTAPAAGGISLGSGDGTGPGEPVEPEFVSVVTPALGGGTRPEHEPAEEPISDRRTP